MDAVRSVKVLSRSNSTALIVECLIFEALYVRLLLPPRKVAQVQEVVTDAAAAEFGDVGHGALVVVNLDTRPDFLDKSAFETFFDDYIDGELSFDYRMKAGPVQRSNAIPLMRSIGLDV